MRFASCFLKPELQRLKNWDVYIRYMDVQTYATTNENVGYGFCSEFALGLGLDASQNLDIDPKP